MNEAALRTATNMPAPLDMHQGHLLANQASAFVTNLFSSGQLSTSYYTSAGAAVDASGR